MRLMADAARSRTDLMLALLIASLSFVLPHGFLIGLVAGTMVHALQPFAHEVRDGTRH